VTIAQFPAFARQYWQEIRSRLLAGTYHPAPVRQVFISRATRSHRGYWWMAGTSIVQRALDNGWLTERGVPSIRQQWIEMHYGKQNEQFNPAAVNLTETA
jgi:hypothetical protein